MLPVIQTREYDPSAPADQQRGNCWTACLASLLEMPINEVPDFVQIEINGGQNWFDHTLAFLYEHRYELVGIYDISGWDDYYIQCGLSPRSPAIDGAEVHHAVIYRNGELVHDPNPKGGGVVSLTNAYGVVKKEAV